MKTNGIENGEWNPNLRVVGRFFFHGAVWAVCFVLGGPGAATAADVEADLKSPADLLRKQDPPKVVPRVLEKANPDNTSVVVSIGRQRAYLFVGSEAAIDAPVSTGKRRGQTPAGHHTITKKAATYSSNRHGDFIDAAGNVVRSGMSTRIDAAPGGTVFRPVAVQYHMALGDEGLALHSGRLPGYPASDTSVRLPVDIAPLIFQRVREGTPVKIEE
jgi:lipoprotein-anchoring transpeptidase ErfK/SrfK